MMAKSSRYSGFYYGNVVETTGESEGSGSSGRFDNEITGSEDSSVPTRRCISLNSSRDDTFGVPLQVLQLSNMSPSERKNLVHRLRSELEQIRQLLKKVEVQRTNGVTLSSSSDILSCSNGYNKPQIQNSRKPSTSSFQGKKSNPPGPKPRGWNRGSTGKFESASQICSPNTANAMLMKQCESLLKPLMKHQYGRVFNTPVDVVKLNIPDYFTIIKHPMDLGTIKGKIASGAYPGPLEFAADVRLTFSNAMTYNPPGNDFHIMADTLNKYFEVRWKAIEKKLPKTDAPAMLKKSAVHGDADTGRPMLPSKKRKIDSLLPCPEVKAPAKQVMTDEDKHKLGRELGSLPGEIPTHIVDFLKKHSSNGRECGEDEIEINMDDLSDDMLFTLRKLLDDYLQEKHKNNAKAEQCEMEVLNDSGPSNSSLQLCKGNDDLAEEDVDIGGNESPVSNYPPVEIEKDTSPRIRKRSSPGSSTDTDSSSSSDSESDDAKTSPVNALKVPGSLGSGVQSDVTIRDADILERNRSASCNLVSDRGLDPLEDNSQQKPSSYDSDCCQDGDSAPTDRQLSPRKLHRVAVLKNRFADTIFKAREKALTQDEKGDPEKLRQEREKLELERQKEKERLQAEAKAAEEARNQAEAEAAAEARRKRELEREAARQKLLQVEKTVEINENSGFFEDLEMLRSAPGEQLLSSVDETSPDHLQDGLGSFNFRGTNPLEQLGLYMKEDDEEEEVELLCVQNHVNDFEEGEID